MIIAIGIGVDGPFQPDSINDDTGNGKGLSEQAPAYHIDISGASMTDSSGRYHIDPNFREGFSNFKSIDIPRSENALDAYDIYDAEPELVTHWKIMSLVIEGDAIAFQTRSYKNERYVFAGTFRSRPRCSIGTRRFEGQLTRLQDDMVVETMNVEFHQVCGC